MEQDVLTLPVHLMSPPVFFAEGHVSPVVYTCLFTNFLYLSHPFDIELVICILVLIVRYLFILLLICAKFQTRFEYKESDDEEISEQRWNEKLADQAGLVG